MFPAKRGTAPHREPAVRTAGRHDEEGEIVSRYDRVQRTTPWIIVAAFLAGAILVGLGITAGSMVLALVGAVTVLVAGVCGAVLPRTGLSAPMSFNENFPESAGRPTTGTSPEDKQPYRELPEVPARRLPKGPDKERAKPQHVNLAPTEHLRQLDGETVIEVPDDEPWS